MIKYSASLPSVEITLDKTLQLIYAWKSLLTHALDYSGAKSNHKLAIALEIASIEDNIANVMRNDASRENYLNKDKELQQGLLLSNDYFGNNGSDEVLKRLQAQYDSFSHNEELKQLFQAKLRLLAEFECLDIKDPQKQSSSPVPDHYTADIFKWQVFLADRRLRNLQNFETNLELQAIDAKFTPKQLYNAVQNGSDLQLSFFYVKPPGGLAKSDGIENAYEMAPMAGGADYSEHKDRLNAVSMELENTAKNIKRGLSPKELDSYCARYGELQQKQEALKYLAEQQKTKMDCLSKAVVSTKEFVSGNMEKKGPALIAGAKVFWAESGMCLAKAAMDAYNGKPVDTDALRKKLLVGLAEFAVTGLSVFLMGPLGATVSGSVCNYFNPKPDPLKESFERLERMEESMKKGFTEIKNKIEDLDKNMEKGFKRMNENFGAWTNYAIDKNKFNLLVNDFQRDIRSADKLMDDAVFLSENIIFKRKHQVNEKELLEFDQKMVAYVNSLIRQFYNRSYSLYEGQIVPQDTDSKEPTLSKIIIDYYKRPGKPFRPFHEVCAEITDISERLFKLAERYFLVRKRVQTALSVLLIHGNTKNSFPDKQEIFFKLLDLSNNETDERAHFFVGTNLLAQKVIGVNVHKLYQSLNTYWEKDNHLKFNMLKGFGMRECVQNDIPSQWLYKPTNEDKPAEGEFELQKNPGKNTFAARYYLPPMEPEQGPERYYFNVYTMQDNEMPVPVAMHIGLDATDTLLISDKSFTELIRATPVDLANPIFAGSFEQFVMKTPDSAISGFKKGSEYSWTLPVKNMLLRLIAPEKQANYNHLRPMPKLYFQNLNRVEYTQPVFPDLTSHEHTDYSYLSVAGGGSDRIELNWSCQYQNTGEVKKRSLTFDVQETKKPMFTNKYGLMKLRPAFGPVSFLEHDHLARLNNMFLFMHHNTLYPEMRFSELRSANGRFRLKTIIRNKYDTILVLFDGEKALGSPFPTYRYRSNHYTVRIDMQQDGNLVMYDQAGHAVAATGSSDKKDTYLHLTNDGRLLLRSIEDNSKIHTIPCADYNMDYGEWNHDTKINRMFEGTMKSGQMLTSENGRYQLKIGLVQSERKNKPLLDQAGRHESDWKNFVCTLELVEGNKSIKNHVEERDDFPNYINRDYWKEPNSEMESYLEKTIESSSGISGFLHVTETGDVNMVMGTRKKWLGGLTNQYGIYVLKHFIPSYEKKNIKTYVEVTNEGKVVINHLETNELIREIF